MTSLVKSLDSEIAKNGKLKSFLVVMTDNPDRTAESLKKLAAENGVKHVPMTLVAEKDGPPDYEISKDADVTILMWRNNVLVNRAYRSGELSEAEIPKIVAELPKILNKAK